MSIFLITSYTSLNRLPSTDRGLSRLRETAAPNRRRIGPI